MLFEKSNILYICVSNDRDLRFAEIFSSIFALGVAPSHKRAKLDMLP